MQNRPSTATGSRHGRLLLLAERLLAAAGAVMLIWSAVLVGDAAIGQRAARLSIEAAAHVPRPAWGPPPAAAPDLGRGRAVPIGAPIAAISIPRIHLSAVVMHGSDPRTLRRGPGHLENTPFPGEPGNVVIAGHRDSFFRPLRHVGLDDDIFLDTPVGRFHYRVTSMRVVDATALEVLAPTDQSVLTLITCYPFWLLGNAPDRFVVRALAVGAPDAPSATATMLDAARLETGVEVSDALLRAPVSNGGRMDDGALVRDAVERFRAAYNGRAGVRMPSQACEVVVARDGATATCRPRGGDPPGGASVVRIFTLVRSAAAWAITSVELR